MQQSFGGNMSVLQPAVRERNMSTAEGVYLLFPQSVLRLEGMRRFSLWLTPHQELAQLYDQIGPNTAHTRFVPRYLDFFALKHLEYSEGTVP